MRDHEIDAIVRGVEKLKEIDKQKEKTCRDCKHCEVKMVMKPYCHKADCFVSCAVVPDCDSWGPRGTCVVCGAPALRSKRNESWKKGYGLCKKCHGQWYPTYDWFSEPEIPYSKSRHAWVRRQMKKPDLHPAFQPGARCQSCAHLVTTAKGKGHCDASSITNTFHAGGEGCPKHVTKSCLTCGHLRNYIGRGLYKCTETPTQRCYPAGDESDCNYRYQKTCYNCKFVTEISGSFVRCTPKGFYCGHTILPCKMHEFKTLKEEGEPKMNTQDITCACGEVSAAGTKVCRYCGELLAGKVADGVTVKLDSGQFNKLIEKKAVQKKTIIISKVHSVAEMETVKRDLLDPQFGKGNYIFLPDKCHVVGDPGTDAKFIELDVVKKHRQFYCPECGAKVRVPEVKREKGPSPRRIAKIMFDNGYNTITLVRSESIMYEGATQPEPGDFKTPYRLEVPWEHAQCKIFGAKVIQLLEAKVKRHQKLPKMKKAKKTKDRRPFAWKMKRFALHGTIIAIITAALLLEIFVELGFLPKGEGVQTPFLLTVLGSGMSTVLGTFFIANFIYYIASEKSPTAKKVTVRRVRRHARQILKTCFRHNYITGKSPDGFSINRCGYGNFEISYISYNGKKIIEGRDGVWRQHVSRVTGKLPEIPEIDFKQVKKDQKAAKWGIAAQREA